jgi:hypothetical protein
MAALDILKRHYYSCIPVRVVGKQKPSSFSTTGATIMTMKSRIGRIAALAERKHEIDAELRKLRAQEAAATRKKNERRKFIVGAIVLGLDEQSPVRTEVMRLLSAKVTRADERALFGLAPLPLAANDSLAISADKQVA